MLCSLLGVGASRGGVRVKMISILGSILVFIVVGRDERVVGI